MFLGRSLTAINQHDEAMIALQRALALRPDSFESSAFLGLALAGKGDRESALTMVKKTQVLGEKCEPAIVIDIDMPVSACRTKCSSGSSGPSRSSRLRSISH